MAFFDYHASDFHEKPDPPTPDQIHDREVHGYGKDKVLYIGENDEHLGYHPERCRTVTQYNVQNYVSRRARRLAKAMIDYLPDSEERTAAIKHLGEAMTSFQAALDKPEGCCDYCWIER